jgi:hypothetical protein
VQLPALVNSHHQEREQKYSDDVSGFHCSMRRDAGSESGVVVMFAKLREQMED